MAIKNSFTPLGLSINDDTVLGWGCQEFCDDSSKTL